MVQLQEVRDKDLLGHMVPIEACQPNKTKDLNARSATNIILVFVDK